jgi:hypothetical protein
MQLDLPIIAIGGYSHRVEETLPDLSAILKESPLKTPRRADRLTLLSLAGLARFPAARALPRETQMILASGDANLDSTISISEQIFADRLTPNPINFINSVNNVTAFHVSAALGIQGQEISLSRGRCSLEAAWQLADSLLQDDDSPILLGTVDEVPGNPDQHRQRMKLPEGRPLGEGSHWFLCARNLAEERPMARVRFCGAVEGIDAALEIFEGYGVSHLLNLTDLPQPSLKQSLELVSPLQRSHYPTQNADDIVQWLSANPAGSYLGMLNRNPHRSSLTISVIEGF